MSENSPEEILAQQKANCIFCKIISKEIPSQIVYEDEDFIAIMDIRPAIKGHILLMPKEHYPILPVIPPELANKMFIRAKKLIRAVEEGTLNSKATLFIANGTVAGQQSPHFLLHIIPREEGDSLPIDPVSVTASEEEFTKIKTVLSSKFKPKPVKSPVSLISKKNNISELEPKIIHERDPIVDLAEALEMNPEVKNLIIKDPKKFKDYVKANPQLEGLFSHININKLSEQLKKNEEEKNEKDDFNKKKSSVLKSEEKKERGADLDKISNLFK